MMYKPYGYLSQFVNNGPKQNSKKLLGELHDFPEGTMSIGRLDEKSEGLLLLSTDGKISYDICGKIIVATKSNQLDSLEKIYKRGVKNELSGIKMLSKEEVLEKEPMTKLAETNNISAFIHDGFWHPMDTLRDKNHLENLWNLGKAPWKKWK